MEKYYTPEIEEFHVGFEFESNYMLFRKGNKGDEWNEYILTKENTWFWDAYENDAVETEFRVKYLDREDIESLGWAFEYSEENNPNVCFTKKIEGHSRGYKNHYTDILWNKVSNKVIIAQGDNETGYDEWDTLFSGTIKNKSELKKLLKQLGI